MPAWAKPRMQAFCMSWEGEVVHVPRIKKALLTPRNRAIYVQRVKGETSIWLARVWGAKIRAVQKTVKALNHEQAS